MPLISDAHPFNIESTILFNDTLSKRAPNPQYRVFFWNPPLSKKIISPYQPSPQHSKCSGGLSSLLMILFYRYFCRILIHQFFSFVYRYYDFFPCIWNWLLVWKCTQKIYKRWSTLSSRVCNFVIKERWQNIIWQTTLFYADLVHYN